MGALVVLTAYSKPKSCWESDRPIKTHDSCKKILITIPYKAWIRKQDTNKTRHGTANP